MARSIPLQTVLQELSTLYAPPRTFLHFRTPFDLLIVTILSAQCTDKRVNKVSTALFEKYNTPQDYLAVKRQELEHDIHSCGTYRNKAKYIQELCKLLLEHYGGVVPQCMEELIKLPGVGRKTAAVVLWAAFGINEGIAVDTHVLRVSRRLGLTKAHTQEAVERDLMNATARAQWGTLTPLLISHGRAVCTARNRKCNECVFRKECPSSLVHSRADWAKGRR